MDSSNASVRPSFCTAYCTQGCRESTIPVDSWHKFGDTLYRVLTHHRTKSLTHTHTHNLKMLISLQTQVFGLVEEPGLPRGNPHSTGTVGSYKSPSEPFWVHSRPTRATSVSSREGTETFFIGHTVRVSEIRTSSSGRFSVTRQVASMSTSCYLRETTVRTRVVRSATGFADVPLPPIGVDHARNRVPDKL